MDRTSRQSAILLARMSVEQAGEYDRLPAIEGKTLDDLATAHVFQNWDRIRVRDGLGCNLLSFSALLLEEGRLFEAREALDETLALIKDLSSLCAGPSGNAWPRAHALEAACQFNYAVLFYLASSVQRSQAALSKERKCLDRLSDVDRKGELAATFEMVMKSELPRFGKAPEEKSSKRPVPNWAKAALAKLQTEPTSAPAAQSDVESTVDDFFWSRLVQLYASV